METTEKNAPTNIADIGIALINGFFNLFKLEKIITFIIVYLIVHDAIFVTKLSENSDVSQWLINTNIINHILTNDNILILILGCIIIFLILLILIILFFVIPIYKKEIERLCNIRSKLMHEPDENGNIKIKKHNTSKKP